MTNPGGGPWGIFVSLGNGDGTFQPAVFYPAGTDTNTQYVVIGDFNGDGILDAATVGSSGVWLFTGVLHRAVRPPASARPLLAVLDKKSPRNKSHVG